MAEIKNKETVQLVETLIYKLRRRQLVGSREAAIETVLLLRQVVSTAKFSSINQLVGMVKGVGRRLVEAQPKEHAVGNVVRKVLRLIREEYYAATAAGSSSAMASGSNTPQARTPLSLPMDISQGPKSPISIANFVVVGHPRHGHLSEKAERSSASGDIAELARRGATIKPVLIQAIQEVLDELETVYENVAKNARDHIHDDEIILTIGRSRTVEAFLKTAAQHRKFTTIVVETAPLYTGREMARSLAEAGISTVLVPDSCVFALMSRVNKVFLGAHTILANGGVYAIAGSLLTAQAARAHSTPVVICAGQFKLAPLWNLYHEFAAVDFGDPAQIFDDGQVPENVDVVNPYYDYVKPELIGVLITNYGSHPPSYVYRLIKETYDDEDLEL